MDKDFLLEQDIGYFQVDREHRIRLGARFQLLQEAAIQHYRILAHNREEEGKSWFLNRLAMRFMRYPKFEETVRIETWISCFSGFKAFREFCIHSNGQTIGQASTVWLYVDLDKKKIAKVPEEIVDPIPTRPNDCFYEGLDRLKLPQVAEGASQTSVSLRYSDFDHHQHVNSAAYLDFLQTGLCRQNQNTHPRELKINFAKEIPRTTESIEVRLEGAGDGMVFSVEASDEVSAYGQVSG